MKKITIMSIIAIIIIVGLLFIKNTNNENKYIDIEENFEWNAKYIWTEIEETEQCNKWVCFRKEFNIDNKEDKIGRAHV